jgi:hypothetical protein
MTAREVDLKLQEADRFSAREMERLELGPAEAALAEAIVAEPAGEGAAEAAPTPWPSAERRHRGRLLGLAGTAAAAVAAVATVLLLVLGGGSQSPSRAYGAELVRFAESTPLLLLDGPDWRVQNVFQVNSREGLAGSMEFVTGPPIPYGSIKISADYTVSGMAPKTVRQRKVELSWRQGELEFPAPPGTPAVRPVESPVLGTTALVNTRAERLYFFIRTGERQITDLGGPGDRQMVAIWKEEGRLLEMRAWVSNLADFKERLSWLTQVDSETWLDAMPAKVVKAADHDATVREMLEGIPLPDTFKPSRVPDEGLTTNRYQVGAAVTGTVSCLWFRQWGQARRTGDRAAKLEAERAMATSRHWPILREMAKDGAYPLTIWQLAAAMPRGELRRGWRLLPHAEGLGCARRGIPVLPWKQRRQNERAETSVRPLDLRP